MKPHITIVIGPTASGKSKTAVERAHEHNGEVISVDSRQVYRMLDIGTEKTSIEERDGIPHHLIDILDPKERYSAGDFVRDATALITDIAARGKHPILAGGSHFYIDALLYGIPMETPENALLRDELEMLSTRELFNRVHALDPSRADTIDSSNRRRLIRALEIIDKHGSVPARGTNVPYDIEWVVINPDRDELYEKISKRLSVALSRGLIEEVTHVRDYVGDERLNELGLEYRIVGEYLRGEREKDTLHEALLSKLSQYARRQRAWLRKLGDARDSM